MIIDFSSVSERYAPDVHRFALYLCGDAAWAEDIAAETFVRAWVTPVEIRAATVKAYLFAITRNLYRAGLEQQARQAAKRRQDQRAHQDDGHNLCSSMEATMRSIKHPFSLGQVPVRRQRPLTLTLRQTIHSPQPFREGRYV